MDGIYWFAVGGGIVALLYGIYAIRSVLASSSGNERMQEIAGAIQEGARAYLNRQYLTIGVVGVVIFVVLLALLGYKVGIGFAIGAILSAAAGYIGMYVSVRANVRTAEAARWFARVSCSNRHCSPSLRFDRSPPAATAPRLCSA